MTKGCEKVTQTKKHILLVGGHEETILMATAISAKWTLIQKPELITDTQKNVCDQVFLLDYENIPEVLSLAKNIHSISKIDIVISFTEYGLEPAAIIQDELKVSGNPKKPVEYTRDKIKMRQLLSDWKTGAIEFFPCSELGDLKTFYQQFGKKIILKPSKGSGSEGICSISSESEIEAAWKRCRLIDPINALLAEEYLEGPEYSIETLSLDGKHEFIAITEKLTTGSPKYVEIGHQLPARLPIQTKMEIESFIFDFLDIIGQKTGPVHSEIRLTKKGPQIIESNTRAGGDFIWQLAEKAIGVDFVRETIEYLVSSKKSIRKKGFGAAAVRYFAYDSKNIIHLKSLDTLKKFDFVVRASCSLKPGEKTKSIESSDDRQGFIVVVGSNTEEAINHAELALASLEIEVI